MTREVVNVLILLAAVLAALGIASFFIRDGKGHSHFYDWYLHSPIWHFRRWSWYWTSNRRCEDCHRRLSLHRRGLRWRMGAEVLSVHHRHYRTLGRERRRDVELLCHSCHWKRDEWRHRR